MKKKMLFLSLLLLPTLVLAKDGDASLFIALFINAFITIHMSVFVLLPLSELLSKRHSKSLFWTMFVLRIVLLLFVEIFINPQFFMVDFISVFIGAFVVVPVTALLRIFIDKLGDKKLDKLAKALSNTVTCPSCGAPINNSYSYCIKCGAKNATAIKNSVASKVTTGNFDSMYNTNDELCLELFLKKEMQAANFDVKTKLMPIELVRRKMVMYVIFALLIGLYVAMIFFHFPLITYILGIVVLVIVYRLNNKYDLMKFLKKKIKERPGEKISNIVMTYKENLVEDTSKRILTGVVLTAVIIPLIIFMKPRIMYEKVDGGYGVRFYTFGLTNFTTATIPETYKGENVVQLRGNTFSNMPFLTSVSLPDTITVIRGQAFKNCYSLKEVNIPSKLESIGGGAFYNCKHLTHIEFPDTVTEMGGEIFKNAKRLDEVRLSQNITEIRGNSFENCTSLTSIEIPDKVVRIGGHAFYGDTSLSEVIISKDSQLEEIGSSAFRRCSSLREIRIPVTTSVNERAFKESPTHVGRFTFSLYTSKEYEDYIEYYYYPDSYKILYSHTSGNDWTLRLDNITVRDSIVIYSFELNGEVYDTFELSSTNNVHIASEDLEIVLLEGSSGSVAKVGIYYN